MQAGEVDREFHARWENQREVNEPNFKSGAARVVYASRMEFTIHLARN